MNTFYNKNPIKDFLFIHRFIFTVFTSRRASFFLTFFFFVFFTSSYKLPETDTATNNWLQKKNENEQAKTKIIPILLNAFWLCSVNLTAFQTNFRFWNKRSIERSMSRSLSSAYFKDETLLNDGISLSLHFFLLFHVDYVESQFRWIHHELWIFNFSFFFLLNWMPIDEVILLKITDLSKFDMFKGPMIYHYDIWLVFVF